MTMKPEKFENMNGAMLPSQLHASRWEAGFSTKGDWRPKELLAFGALAYAPACLFLLVMGFTPLGALLGGAVVILFTMALLACLDR